MRGGSQVEWRAKRGAKGDGRSAETPSVHERAFGRRLIPQRAIPLERAMSAQQLSQQERGNVQRAISALSPGDSATLRASVGVVETLCERLEGISAELADVKDSLVFLMTRLDEEGVTHDLQAIHAAHLAMVLQQEESQRGKGQCEQHVGREGAAASKGARVIKQHLKERG